MWAGGGGGGSLESDRHSSYEVCIVSDPFSVLHNYINTETAYVLPVLCGMYLYKYVCKYCMIKTISVTFTI